LERHEEANAFDNLRSLCRSCHLKFDHANGARHRMDELLRIGIAEESVERMPV
jgi:5-methylcytosine-specific restriction endonuclease McrA